MAFKIPPLPAQPFNLIALPYTSNNVYGDLDSSQSSLGEELGILYDNKVTFPAGRGILNKDLGII